MTVFRRNLGIVAIASLARFVISIGLTPLMTRLYSPADYGVFVISNNAATFLSALAVMALPGAIPLENRLHKRRQIVRAVVHIVTSVFLVGILGSLIFISNSVESGRLALAVMLFPFLFLSISIQRLAQSWINAKGDFKSTAGARVIHPLIAKLGAIVAAICIGPFPATMVAVEALGYVVQVKFMLRKSFWTVVALPKICSLRRWRATIGTVLNNKDMSLFGNASNLLALGVVTLEPLIVAKFFSVNEAGLFSLAYSMASLPVSLISFSTATVVYHRFIDTHKSNEKDLYGVVCRVATIYLFLGLPIYGVLFFLGPIIFSIVFGESWGGSGVLASALALPMLLSFISTPLLSVFRVTRSQKLNFRVDAVMSPLVIAAFFAVARYGELANAVYVLAVLSSFHSIFLLFLCLRVSYGGRSKLSI
jgi:O-antigen/teichoic acid export membrane protein